MQRRFLVLGLAAVAALTMGNSGCSNDVDKVKHNMSEAAGNFEVPRKISFYNTRSDRVMLEVTGFCDFSNSKENSGWLNVICKKPGGYVKHSQFASNDTTILVEHLDPSAVSQTFYRYRISPLSLIPDVSIVGNRERN